MSCSFCIIKPSFYHYQTGPGFKVSLEILAYPDLSDETKNCGPISMTLAVEWEVKDKIKWMCMYIC